MPLLLGPKVVLDLHQFWLLKILLQNVSIQHKLPLLFISIPPSSFYLGCLDQHFLAECGVKAEQYGMHHGCKLSQARLDPQHARKHLAFLGLLNALHDKHNELHCLLLDLLKLESLLQKPTDLGHDLEVLYLALLKHLVHHIIQSCLHTLIEVIDHSIGNVLHD